MEKWFYEMYGMPYSAFHQAVCYKGLVRYEIFVVSNLSELSNASFLLEVAKYIKQPPVAILPNVNGALISSFQGNNYVVLVGESGMLHWSDMEVIHELSPKQTIELIKISELWILRLNHIEENILPNLPSLLKYEELLVDIYMAMAFSESAIHYLQYIQGAVLPACFTHARLSHLESFYVLNPLYTKVDHESRDLIELYNAKLVTSAEVMTYLKTKRYTKDELLYVVARLLYPTLFFDYLEELFISQQWKLHDIYDLKAEISHKVNLAIPLIQLYELPPIDYLFSFWE